MIAVYLVFVECFIPKISQWFPNKKNVHVSHRTQSFASTLASILCNDDLETYMETMHNNVTTKRAIH